MQCRPLEGGTFSRPRSKARDCIYFSRTMLGKLASDFTLLDQHGAPATLSDYRGRNAVVLIFYVVDNTPG